jgi:hypothetical protein
MSCKGTLRQVFICLRPPPLLGFCLGGILYGSDSGQIQSVKLMQNNGIQQNLKPPPPLTHCIRIYHIIIPTGKGEGGGELNQREGYRGNSSQSWVENTNMT